MSEVGRAIDDHDRGKLLATLTQWAAGRSFLALRTRALVLLAWGSALRISELLALNVDQVLEDPRAATLGRIRSTGYVRGEQSKGRRKGPQRWTSAGTFIITKPARAALRDYLIEALERGYLTLPASSSSPLFVALKGRVGKGQKVRRGRLGKRAAQSTWDTVQRKAGLHDPYRFHDLRHDALTRLGEAAKGNPFRVAQYGRLKDIRTASRYVHGSIATLAELAELAAAPGGRTNGHSSKKPNGRRDRTRPVDEQRPENPRDS